MHGHTIEVWCDFYRLPRNKGKIEEQYYYTLEPNIENYWLLFRLLFLYNFRKAL